MATIGVTPTKTSVELRDEDGAAGTIPAASRASAGVATASQITMLEDIHARLLSPDSQVSIPIDTAQFVSRDELSAKISAIPNASAAIAQMHTRLAALEASVQKIDDTLRALHHLVSDGE